MFHQQPVHRLTADIHERLRLGEQHPRTRHCSLPHQRAGILAPNLNTVPHCQSVHNQEAQVVGGFFVIFARIAETNHQLLELPGHRSGGRRQAAGGRNPIGALPSAACRLHPAFCDHFFLPFSFSAGFSAFSGSAPSSSFLPFLITSGSAGVATSAPASAAGATTSSAFMVTTCAITCSGALSSFIEPLSGISPARRF